MTGVELFIANLGTLSYAGIWVVSFLSNMVIPFPEEIVLLILGYLSSSSELSIWIIIPVVISGLLVNDIIIYHLSKKGSRLVHLIYTRFLERRMSNKSNTWIVEHLGKVVFISRFLMQLRFIGPFMAGQKKMAFKRFIVYELAALVIYVPLYLFLGRYFHHRVEMIIEEIGVIKNIILIGAGIVVAYAAGSIASRALFSKKISTDESPLLPPQQ